MTIAQFSHSTQQRIDGWTPLRRTFHQCFEDKEIEKIGQLTTTFDTSKRTIVFVAFENRHVALGGLAAVAKYLPRALRQQGEKVIFLSPYYKNHPGIIAARKESAIRKLGRKQILLLDGVMRTLHMYLDKKSEIETYYLAIDTFFTAKQDPYSYAVAEQLSADALSFCSAVPLALKMLGLTDNCIIHANDWETALVAFTTKVAMANGTLGPVKTILTLHNSFDAPISPAVAQSYVGRNVAHETFLQSSIPFLDAPLTTVSTPYAREMLHDPQQVHAFCGHLGKVFAQNPPIGIENGAFGNRQRIYSENIIKESCNGNFGPLLKRKLQLHKQLIATIEKQHTGKIAGRLEFSSDDAAIPIFFMTGRMDLRQKGFDTIFHAFSRLKKGNAKLIFSPSNADKKTLDFFAEFAETHAGDITIWPFRIPDNVYHLVLGGVGFLVMPSLYEPFGSANEGYLHGTPVVARATGGLWTQVCSLKSCTIPQFYGKLFAGVPAVNHTPTGILYRECYQERDIGEQWQRLFNLPSAQRMSCALYCSIVDAAFDALITACDLYADKKMYSQIVFNGMQWAKNLEWFHAAKSYKAIYDISTKRSPFD